MPGFYIESCTRLTWIKREYSLSQIFSLVYQNFSEEVLLTEPKIQAKVPSFSGDCVFGEDQLNHGTIIRTRIPWLSNLSLMVKGLGIFSIV